MPRPPPPAAGPGAKLNFKVFDFFFFLSLSYRSSYMVHAVDVRGPLNP